MGFLFPLRTGGRWFWFNFGFGFGFGVSVDFGLGLRGSNFKLWFSLKFSAVLLWFISCGLGWRPLADATVTLFALGLSRHLPTYLVHDTVTPQRCICQESEVLARIALRSLGRFVTSMHKSFPIASATIIRRQAAPGEEEGVTDLTKEGKDVSGPRIEPCSVSSTLSAIYCLGCVVGEGSSLSD